MEILNKAEELKLRGVFTARNKIIYPEAIYHLTQRAPGREKLFLEDKDYLYMLSLIKESSLSHKWKIFSFALLSNHLHVLLQIKEPNLSHGAKSIFERYAKYFNFKYQRKGPVFCKPFRVSLCLDESYLLAISLYIHLNPSKAGIVSNPVCYKWSSINLFTGKDLYESFVEYKFILSMLNEDLNKAKDVYRNLLKAANYIEYKNVLEAPNFLKKFRLLVSNILDSRSVIKKKSISQEWSFDKEIKEFRNKKYSRDPKELNARRYLIEQLLANGYRIAEIYPMLGVNRRTVYNILSQNKRRSKCDKIMRRI